MNRILAFTFAIFTALLPVGEPTSGLMQRVMKAADKNKDGKLSLAEYKTLDVQAKHHGNEHFAAGDTNKDAFIDTSELPGSLQKQTWFAILSEGITHCFTRLDADKDGKLDPNEYRKISKMGGHSDQHFNAADANQDGFLQLVEFNVHSEAKLKVLEGNSVKSKKNRTEK